MVAEALVYIVKPLENRNGFQDGRRSLPAHPQGVRLTMNGKQTARRAVWRDSLARLQNRIGFEAVLV